VQGHLDVVKLLVGESGADMQAKDDNRWTSLHFAMSQGHAEVVRFLLAEIEGYTNRYELFVDVADDYGRTSLHYAADMGNFDIVRLLVEKFRVPTDARDKNNSTPLHKALDFKREYFSCSGLICNELSFIFLIAHTLSEGNQTDAEEVFFLAKSLNRYTNLEKLTLKGASNFHAASPP
jgi:ankyrin repeat protein